MRPDDDEFGRYTATLYTIARIHDFYADARVYMPRQSGWRRLVNRIRRWFR